MRTLERFLHRLQRAERLLMPRRKQRALEEMTHVIASYRRQASADERGEAFAFYDRLLNLLERPNPDRPPDWNDMAERWLDLIRPVWYRRLADRRRVRPLLLQDLRVTLTRTDPLPFHQVREAFNDVRAGIPLDERVAACIIGVA
jgi:hypothetical protein